MKHPAVNIALIVLAVALALGNLVQLASNNKLRDRIAELENGSGTAKNRLSETGARESSGGVESAPQDPTAAGGGIGESKLVGMKPRKKPDETFSSIAEQYAKSVQDNPAIQKQMLAQFEAQLGDVLDDLYTDLGLEGDDLGHFKGLMAEHWRVQAQVPMQLMSAMGDPDKTAEIKENLQASREATDERIREFLNSDEDYDYYQSYRDQIPDRMEVNQYRDALEAGGLAFSDEQEAQLITAMSEERKASGLGDVNDPMQWEMEEFNEESLNLVMGQMTDFHSRVQVRAGSILEQEQVSVLADSQKDIRQQQELGMRFGLQMMEAMKPKAEAGEGGE